MLDRRNFLSKLLWGGTGLILSQSLHTCQSSTPKPNLSLAQNSQDSSAFPLPPRRDIRLVVMSDLNSQYGSVTYEPEVHQAIALIQQWQPDLVLCGGDMVAGQSKALTNAQVEAMWTAFDRVVAQPLNSGNIPFGFTLGNHDASGYQSAPGNYVFQRDRQLAQAYWNRAKSKAALDFVDDQHFPFYYSFRQNNIFYLVWDATTANITETQRKWVEQSLAGAQDASFRMVIGHLPLYAIAVGRNKPGEIMNNAAALQQLLEQYRVNTYISGHHHAYYPGQKDSLKFLHAGALGGGPRALLGSSAKPYKSITVVDIDLTENTLKHTTLNLTTGQLVDIQTLPTQIRSVNGVISRDNTVAH